MKTRWGKIGRSLVLMLSSSTLFLSFLSDARAAEQESFLDYSGVIAYGSYGEDGTDGQDGATKIIFPEDLPTRLDLSGSNGSDGSSGAAGRSASCSSSSDHENTEDLRPLPSSQPYRFSGSDGSRGGDGGDGGDGGSLLVFYRSLEDLSQVFVVSNGGQGGDGGRGGAGGRGCHYCPPDLQVPEVDLPDLTETEIPNLNQVKAKGDHPPQTAFKDGALSCVTKPSGTSGSPGHDGKDGEMGRLYLAEHGTGLTPDQPAQSVQLSSFEQNQALSLSRNLWDARQGALALLAPGSAIADEYYEYSGRLERDYVLVWDAPQPATDFPNGSVKLTLTQTGEIELVSPEDVWLASQMSVQAGVNQLTIEQVVKREEASQLAWGNFSGHQSNLSLSLIDRARKSDILATQFQLTYRVAPDQQTDRPMRRTAYVTRYDGPIPPELVERDHQRFTLSLGDLPIDAQYLRAGLNVEIELTAIRSLGGRSAEQKIVWRGKLES